MKLISIVIPAYNEEASLPGLLASLDQVRYPSEAYEVIVVNDGSTDRTAQVARQHPGVRLVDLPANLGRFACRQRGAAEARFPYLLFIDAHSLVDAGILEVLDGLEARAVNGRVLPAERPGPFETFYQAIRRRVYAGSYGPDRPPFTLTAENFDALPKGTTVFFVEKALLEQVYQDLAGQVLGRDSSDDTRLLRAVVARAPILNHPAVRIIYLPRTSFRASLGHLYQRGPKFVDYYLDPAQRNFWLVIIMPGVGLAALLAGLLLVPAAAWAKLAVLLALDGVAALVLARSPREWAVNAVMLPLCGLVFYAGILMGLVMRLSRRL